MAGNKETSIGIKLVADLRNYQKNLSTAQKQTRQFKGAIQRNMGSVTQSLREVGRGNFAALPDLFRSVTRTVGGATKGMKLFKTALIGTGIGAIIVALASLAAAFTTSEEGAAKLKRILDPFKVLFDNIIDVLADFGEKIIWAFENPKEAVNDLWETIKQNFIVRFNAIPKLVMAAMKVVKSVFSDGSTKDAVKELGTAFAELTTGFDENDRQKILDWAKQNNVEMEKARQLADKKYQTDLKERKHLVERAKMEAEVARLRLQAREVQFTDPRAALNFLQKAQKVQDDLLRTDMEIAKARHAIQEEQNTYARSSTENLNKEAELKARIYQIQTARENSARQIQREVNTLVNKLNSDLEKQKELTKGIADNTARTANMTTMQSIGVTIDQPEADTGQLDNMGRFIDANTEKVQRFRNELSQTLTLNEQIAIMAGSFGTLGNAIGGAAGSFMQMAANVLNMIPQLLVQVASLTGAESSLAIAMGVKNSQMLPPPFNIIMLAATVASIVSALSTKPPALASGGIAYGNTIAQVGEYSGARANPEVIAPLDKLKTLLPRATDTGKEIIIPSLKLKDDHIEIMYNRATTRKNRRT